MRQAKLTTTERIPMISIEDIKNSGPKTIEYEGKTYEFTHYLGGFDFDCKIVRTGEPWLSHPYSADEPVEWVIDEDGCRFGIKTDAFDGWASEL
jgi:hypothetical protein|tara:strand:- start:1220 stop:1501 length:282 start_codon:yes stop_codon:yes gene_type:complete